MKKRLALAGGIAGGILAALGTAALAFIIVTGVGTSSADAYTTKALVVQHQTPTLIPGVQGVEVPLTITNPNSYKVKVTSIGADVDAPRGCHIRVSTDMPLAAPADNSHGPGVPPTGNTTTVGANGTLTLHGVVFVSQDRNDDASCKYTLTVTVSGELGNG